MSVHGSRRSPRPACGISVRREDGSRPLLGTDHRELCLIGPGSGDLSVAPHQASHRISTRWTGRYSRRAIAERLSQSLGTSVVAENKPGAGGMLATQDLLSQPADGYTLQICTYFDPVNTLLYRK